MNGGPIIPLDKPLGPMPGSEPAAPIGSAGRGGHRTSADAKRSRAHPVRRRFALLNAFIDGPMRGLCRADTAAWLLLYRHAKPCGTVSASVADVARRTGCSERTARYALERLVTVGLVRRLKRGTLAGGPSIWRLLPPNSAGS